MYVVKCYIKYGNNLGKNVTIAITVKNKSNMSLQHFRFNFNLSFNTYIIEQTNARIVNTNINIKYTINLVGESDK